MKFLFQKIIRTMNRESYICKYQGTWHFSKNCSRFVYVCLCLCLDLCLCVHSCPTILKSQEQGFAIRMFGSPAFCVLCFESWAFCFSELNSLGLVSQALKTGSSNAFKCGIAWKEIKILVQLDLERSFFNDPFKQLPAKLQTIVWLAIPSGDQLHPTGQRAATSWPTETNALLGSCLCEPSLLGI